MSPRRKRYLIFASTLCVWAASGYVLYWGCIVDNVRIEDTSTLSSSPSIEQTLEDEAPQDPRADVTVAEFESVWQRPLRRVLYDPPPPPAPKQPDPPKKQQPPRIQAQLLATMIEANDQTAMLQLNGNEVVFRKVGDSVSAEHKAAIIREIRPGLVIIQQEGHFIEYAVDGVGGS